VSSIPRSRLETSALAPVLLGAWAALIGLAPDIASKCAIAAPVLLGALLWWTALSASRWLALFLACLLLLPPLPFPVGNAGAHIAPIFALLGLLVGVLRATEWRRWRGPLPFFLCLFLAVLVESLAFAALYSGWSVAFGSLLRILLFATSVYVFLYTLAGPGGPESDPVAFARFLFRIGTLGALFACVDFYFQFPAPAGYSAQFVWLEEGVFRRAQGVFYEASTLGNFCAFFVVMILVASFPPRNEDPICSRAALAVGGVIFSTALIFSYSRASWAAVAVAGCALVYVRRLKIRRVLIVSIAALVAAAGSVRFALPAFSSSYWSRIEASFQYFGSSPDDVLSGRLSSWNTLVDFLFQHPWHAIFGIGYKTIPYTDYIGQGLVADNTYLSLLVETGVVGLLAFTLLNVAILRTALRAARSTRSRASFFGTWIFCFWSGEIVQMLSGDLITYWRVLPLYFWVLATAARESAG
jgi:O-antigen ligase